ncbi:MAG: (deoxy)nucleoside triphosphate pyrophosphohydrolase [Faecalibacterium sp.]|nr:(deoxy)nucleoside triphosphate pyrophosphohydrolase [Faecalibacterium sp.]
MQTAEVVAALVKNGDKFLICQRPKNKARGLLWEFVGGKVENGETEAEALKRELREELDVSIETVRLFERVRHEYPDLTVYLSVYEARIVSGEPKMLEHNDIKWISSREIDDYDFCPADEAILRKIKKEF